MSVRGGAVLVVTDLTPKSDVAMLAAAELAIANDMELHVMHAVELRNRPLREVLISLEARTRERETVREQMRRLLPESLQNNPPIVEFDRLDVALDRCMRHICPSFVVLVEEDEIVVRDERVTPIPA